MKSSIKQVLKKINDRFGASIFTDSKQFKAVLDDVQIDAEAKKIRHLLNVAVRDIQSYSRLESSKENDPFIIENLVAEMASDYMIEKDAAKMVIECIAELLGFGPEVDAPFDWENAVAQLQNMKKSPQEDAVQEYGMGLVYYHGDIREKDWIKAKDCFYRAATQGHVEAQCALADLFSDETNPNADSVQGMEWYAKAAENGHAKAQALLGAGYFSGIGREKDIERAKYWFQKSADQGNAEGQCFLGIYYFMQEKYAESEPWLRKAMKQGHLQAKATYEMAEPLFRK